MKSEKLKVCFEKYFCDFSVMKAKAVCLPKKRKKTNQTKPNNSIPSI